MLRDIVSDVIAVSSSHDFVIADAVGDIMFRIGGDLLKYVYCTSIMPPLLIGGGIKR